MRSDESDRQKKCNATHCLRIIGGLYMMKMIARKSGFSLTSYWLLDEL